MSDETAEDIRTKLSEIPEGVYQIRASSYYLDMKLEIRGDSVKLWEQMQQERLKQQVEALRRADDSLATLSA